ncbi:WD40 repeat domain-containing protein [bacterium]|nr:WD40 repeat domain-containing protein [bacterium]
MAFSPDGKRAATGECCRQARLWDLAAEREIGAEARGAPTESTTIALTRDGRRALVPCGDGLLRIWELASGKMLAPFERSPADLNTLALSPDEKRVVTAHHRRTVQAWDVATGARIWARTDAHANNVLAVAVSPDGRRALSGADESTLKLWDMDSGKEAGRFEALPGVWVLSVAFSPDGKQVLVAGVAGERREQGSLELFSLDGDTATQTKRLSGHQAGVHGVAFLPDGKRALTASADATLKLWDLATGAVLRSFAHEARVLRALPVAGERAVSTSDDGTIRLWDLSSGAEVDRIDLASSHDAPYGLAVSRDGRSIFAATHLGVLLRFDERERR